MVPNVAVISLDAIVISLDATVISLDGAVISLDGRAASLGIGGDCRLELNLMVIGLLWMAELFLRKWEWEGRKLGLIKLGLGL